MANPNRTALAPLVTLRPDGWLHCRQCQDAFWGAGNVTAVVADKARKHAAKAHAAAPAGRPQRRAAAAQADADAPLTLALATALAKALGGDGLPRKLGQGVSRYVFDLGDSVLKLPHGVGERKHNLAEAKAWATAPADKRRWLAPVLACSPDGAWLVMAKAQRVGHPDWADHAELQDELPIGDLHEANVGYIGRQLVAIDYAGGWQAREVRW
jgi:hypothetical protein